MDLLTFTAANYVSLIPTVCFSAKQRKAWKENVNAVGKVLDCDSGQTQSASLSSDL